MRRFAALACTAATALAALLTASPPAAAGGPTTVLITSQTTEEAAALLTDTERYRQLEQLLGPATAERAGDGRAEPALDGRGKAAGRHIGVSWMSQDVSVWRTDTVYPDAEAGEVWIRTVPRPSPGPRPGGPSARPGSPDQGFWHPAEKPDDLRALLKDLGVMGEERARAGRPPGRTAAGEGRAVPAAVGSESGGPAWWWGVPGFAVGMGIGCGGTLLMRRWLSRSSLDEPGPRQHLLDI
ncbi:hypothetical protein AB0C51_12350 [Streptomyces pathocidini]|uniref:hypothetical protein n=1 Tax=Streptomyces pathocidini TaxID=1650571 RepID=UPI0033E9728A